MDHTDITEYYNEVPVEPHALQDALFQILLTLQTCTGLDLMESDVAIAPRHVNELLAVHKKRPDLMLLTLQQCWAKQVVFGNLCYSAERHELCI